MHVPRMYRDWTTGGRQVWAPELVNATEDPVKSRAGSKITEVVRSMGGTATATQLHAVVGRGYTRQAASAVANGLLIEAPQGVFTVVRPK